MTIKDVGATSIMIGAATIISYIVAREQLATNIGNWIFGITAENGPSCCWSTS
jgi:TRAP-type C4-dicarboxylate transport system permease large subunit